MIDGFESPSGKEFVKLKRKISSWNKTAELAYNTNDSLSIYTLLYVEQKAYNRPYNVLRLYQRFNRLRCNEELRNLDLLLDTVPVKPSLKEHLRNNIYLSLHLQKVKADKEYYLILLKTEYLTKSRPHMLRKLYGSFQKLRRAEEVKLL